MTVSCRVCIFRDAHPVFIFKTFLMKKLALLLLLPVAFASQAQACDVRTADSVAVKADTVSIKADTIQTPVNNDKYYKLTDDDYQRVAEELGIDVATMKAVVEIEAGSAHQGFAEPGIPLVNFDLVVFKRFMRKAGKSYSKYTKSTAFQRPNTRKYGSYGKAQWARLESARKINKEIAEKATFWGMFQIGGFNWKKCGCSSIDEFVERMCRSEQEQLELFAQFCIHMDLVKYLKKHDWNSFAYHYNGPRYRSLGYHTRLRKAYAKHK